MNRWSAVPAALVAGLVALPLPASASSVDPQQFGMHVRSLGAGVAPQVRLGAVRLWDAGVRWDQVETAKGKYNWAALDRAVGAAQAAGATEIVYVLGSTPKWAASTLSSVDLYGPGTASLPKKNRYYLDYAKAVAERYRGRITAYQIWNEANTRSFFNGGKYDGWVKLATLTKKAAKSIRSVDPAADIVAASSTVIPTPKFQTESFFFRYLRELKRQNAKVDALAVHLYPVNPKQGPDARVASISAVRQVMRKVGYNKPLWDTEVNYGDRRTAKQVVPKPKKAAAFVARTYLDSARYGIARTFWYGWDIDVLGVSLTNPDGSLTKAGQAFGITRDWLTAGDWKGCKDVKGVTTCSVGSTTIAYAAKPASIKRPAGISVVCKLSGSCRPAGPTVKLSDSPVRLA
ncbi:MAG TPA: glycosyl hydrolase [Actinomycetota bacterium]|nr:glycosyl hydrolase [Actinomycetota bacterium]